MAVLISVTLCIEKHVPSFLSGLFEMRAAEYLNSYPETELSGVNRFLKGLGKSFAAFPFVWSSMKKNVVLCLQHVFVCREQNEILAEEVRRCPNSLKHASHTKYERLSYKCAMTQPASHSSIEGLMGGGEVKTRISLCCPLKVSGLDL